MTRIIHLTPRGQHADAIAHAARILRRGGLIIFPTETLYGLGARASSQKALSSLVRAKHRPRGKGFIVLIASPGDLKKLVHDIPVSAKKLMRTFWPGPLTLVFKKRKGISAALTGNQHTIAIRLTSHPIARALIRGLGSPITAPSANVSGHPAPRTVGAAVRDLSHARGIVLALDAGRSPEALPSTIVDVSGDTLHILRVGTITKKHIMGVLKKR